MGKCKRRLIARAKNDKNQLQITRSEALAQACSGLIENSANKHARNLITLFGLSAEELAEGGVSYELLRSLDGFII